MKRAIRLAILLPVAVVAVALEMAGVLDRIAAGMELDEQGFRTAQVEDAANEVLADLTGDSAFCAFMLEHYGEAAS